MKDFKKTEDGLFICEECGKICKNHNSLRIHVQRVHNPKIYHNKWLKEENEGKCKTCGKETKFTGTLSGYTNCCSKVCTDKYRYEQNKKSNLIHFNCENNFQKEEVKAKIEKTNKRLYGHKNIAQGIKKQQIKNTMMEKYGVEYAFQNKNLISKFHNTMITKYGFAHALQNKEFFIKANKTNFRIKKFKNTNIWYQGSYELDFLEKYYNLFPDIKRGLSIKYFFEGKQHYYFSDFYVPSLNLIIEIKSSYWYKIHRNMVKLKKKTCVEQGYNYIIIVDKNYDKFNYQILSLLNH